MSLLAFVNCIGLAFVYLVKYRKQQVGERAPLSRLSGISCSQKRSPGLVPLHWCRRQLKEIISSNIKKKPTVILGNLGLSDTLGENPSSTENRALEWALPGGQQWHSRGSAGLGPLGLGVLSLARPHTFLCERGWGVLWASLICYKEPETQWPWKTSRDAKMLDPDKPVHVLRLGSMLGKLGGNQVPFWDVPQTAPFLDHLQTAPL